MSNVVQFPLASHSGGRMTSGGNALQELPKAVLPYFVDPAYETARQALEVYEAAAPVWRPTMYRNRRWHWFRQFVRWITL